MDPAPAVCYLVGAGPGHPGLLTLRAVDCLRRADVVLYDKLVPVSMLEHAPPTAEKVCVADVTETGPHRHQPVHDAMIDAARAGKTVVRLKGGDPCLFGRGGEEAEALRRAGVSFEIVPGVTAALGAAAFAAIPLTHRSHVGAVAFITGHDHGGQAAPIDWHALARFPGTLVFYMGMSRLPWIAHTLIHHGLAPDTPAAVVQKATLGEQQTLTATLRELPGLARAEGLSAPAIVIIGSVVGLRGQLAWFEQQPLFGRRILVTRPRHQAAELVARLVELGAVPFVLPAVEILPLTDWTLVDRALADLRTYDWLVFTSANGVEALLGRLPALGLDLRALGGVKLAAIGPKTAEALERYHLRADLVPERYQSEDLAAALRRAVQPGARVLLARADRGREVLREQLAEVCHVDQIAVYAQVDAVDVNDEALGAVRRGEIDYITLTSSNIARALVAMLDAPARARLDNGEVRLVTISPVTSAEVRRLGLPVAAEAASATTDGIVTALIALASRESAHLAERLPRQVNDQAGGEQRHDVHRHAQAAEGNFDDQIEQE